MKALTVNQETIIKGLAEGRTLKQLAYETRRSCKTIDTHKTIAMRKLGVHSRAELVHFCIATGLIALKFDSMGKRV